jgi:hypothetical protein
MTEQFQKVIRSHTEELAKRVAAILTDADCDQQAELSKAYEQFDNDLADDIAGFKPNHHASQIADLLVESGSLAPRKGEEKGRPFTRESALHYLFHTSTGSALLRRLSLSKKDESMPDFISMTKAINKADGAVSNLTQSEYLEMGRAKYGKAAFDKMMIEDADIFNAVSALHANDIRKWSAKYHGTPPQYSQSDVDAEIKKIRGSKVPESQSGWRNVDLTPTTSNSLASVPDDIRAMAEREMQTASWLTPEQAYARALEATRAAERVAERRRQANRGTLPRV